MPPPMQLQQKAPRHAHGSLPRGQLPTNRIIDIPNRKPRDENQGAPSTEFEDLGFDEWVGDAGGDDGAGFEADGCDHEAEEHGVHGQLVGDAVPGAEGGHEEGDEEARGNGDGEGFVEGEDAVEDGGCGDEHGEVVTPLCVVLECCVED